MATEWIKSEVKGLRYREHPNKTIGAGRYKRPLRYYMMTYKWQDKTLSEALGWEPEIFTEWQGKPITGKDAAEQIFNQLRNNRRNNVPPFTLKEYQGLNQEILEEATRQEEAEIIKNKTFAEVWTDNYYPHIQANRRSQKAVETEEMIYRLWISPVIGKMPLAKIATLPHMQNIKKRMATAGKSARTIRYALDIVRQVYNHADLKNIYRGRNPAVGQGVERPREDNRRHRSLSPEEGQTLLDTLLKHSRDVHDMALLSMHAGLRYGEVASLCWGAVDLFNNQGVLLDTKSTKNRSFFMIPAVKAMFAGRKSPKSKPSDLVFPDRNGNQQPKISKTFRIVADELFNQGVTDPRSKVVFHSLRRTFATQLLKQGTNIYAIQRLLGHADITTTSRYLDVDDDELKDEVQKLHRQG